ncbi:MAG: hypothetical protein LBE13_21620, partial [Bacteroidales bacterium]|nr:hypothetical protein [Bacteroidales bacterium]
RSEATPCRQRNDGTEKTLYCWGLLRSCLPRNDDVFARNDGVFARNDGVIGLAIMALLIC